MKINFPRIVREVNLNEYAPELDGQKIFVWVNPPSKELAELDDLNKAYVEDDKALDPYLDKLSILLSQGSDEKAHCSRDDLKEIIEGTAETDPLFWNWLQVRIVREVNDHRLQRKKA